MRCEEKHHVEYIVVDGTNEEHHDGKRVCDLAISAQHAREIITVPLSMALLNHYKSKPPKRCTIVAPIVNYWGVERVFAGDHARRKDELNTDLNRNWYWPPDSNKCGHLYQQSPDYYREWSGPEPLSSPGSKFLMFLYSTYHIRVLVNTHSGIWSLYRGFDAHWDRPIPNEDRHEAKLQRIRKQRMCPKCGNDIGEASVIDDYQA